MGEVLESGLVLLVLYASNLVLRKLDHLWRPVLGSHVLDCLRGVIGQRASGMVVAGPQGAATILDHADGHVLLEGDSHPILASSVM